MKRMVTIAGVFALAMATQPALAADIPVAPTYKAPVAAPIFNWSGFYAGLNAGYSWGRTAVDYRGGAHPLFLISAASQRLSPNSPIVGGQFGYNHQAGAWVFGFEADLAWRDASKSFSVVAALGDTLTVRASQKWFGTVRGRLGMTVTPRALLYVTGGLAYGRFERSIVEFCDILCDQLRTSSRSKTKFGWTLGGGLEVALDQNWFFALEYLYMDFGSDRVTATDPIAGAFGDATTSFKDRSHVVWAKLNFRFATGMAHY